MLILVEVYHVSFAPMVVDTGIEVMNLMDNNEKL
jgi:hypothetical protein